MTSPSLPLNHCSNPDLAANANGWGVISGGAGQRVTLWDSRNLWAEGEVFHYRLDNTISNPRIYLPSKGVSPGETWGFGVSMVVEAFTAAGSCQARMQVDWYDADDNYLGHTDGSWVRVNYGVSRFVGHLFTAPANADRANVTVALSGVITPNSWALTGAFYAVGEVHNPTLPDLDENIAPNPLLEVDATGWGVVANAANPQRVEVDYYQADHAFQAEATNADPATAVVEPALHAPTLEVFAENIYRIRIDAGLAGIETGSGGARLRVDFFEGETLVGSSYGSAESIGNEDWASLSGTFTTPAGSDSLRVVVLATAVPAVGITARLLVTNAAFVRNPLPLAEQPRPSTPLPPDGHPNLCPNPRLETDATGWSSPDGVTRVAVATDLFACESPAHEAIDDEYANTINLPDVTSVAFGSYRFWLAVQTSEPGRAFLRITPRDSAGDPIGSFDSTNVWVDSTGWARPNATAVPMPAGTESVSVALHTYGMDVGNGTEPPVVRATAAVYQGTDPL